MYHYRTILVTLCIFVNTLLSAQQDDLRLVNVKTDIYEITYSQTYQQPINIAYSVTCSSTDVTYSRTGLSFKRVDSIKTSTPSDYRDNVWDKGHMVPAAAFSCKEDWLKSTFSYVNCALQHQNLNRGAWATLEQFERDLATIYGPINVKIDVEFSDQWTTNSDPARIPSKFIKTITWDSDGQTKTIMFNFPNNDTEGRTFWAFKLNN